MRILHTMLRVGDLDKSIDFYVNRLGMNLLRKKDYPHGKFTLAFVGYGSEKENTVIELTYNWDKKSEDYELGDNSYMTIFISKLIVFRLFVPVIS